MFHPEPEDEEYTLYWASTDEISKYWQISSDFLRKVLDLDPAWTFLSDLSTLRDFDIAPEVLEREIFLRYGVEIDDLEDRRLVDIFTRIEEEGILP